MYWGIAILLVIVGFVMLIVKSVKNQPLKPALQVLITGVILLVIGAGACAALLSNF